MKAATTATTTTTILRMAEADDEDEDDDDEDDDDVKKENPYADPNYPDLEFVNYDDPDYKVDQGMGDEFFDTATASTEEQVEAMREERRMRNDEFQFETYFAEVLKNGDDYKGEWTVYKSSTFLNTPDKYDANGLPRLIKAKKVLKTISRGYKVQLDDNDTLPSNNSDRKGDTKESIVERLDGQRICHEEVAVTEDESNPYQDWQNDLDIDSGFGRSKQSEQEDDDDDANKPQEELRQISAEAQKIQAEILGNTYWPHHLSPFDFRGKQGNMVVGDAYTICTSVPLTNDNEPHEGPHQELRCEVGIHSKQLRFRIKLDYSVLSPALSKELSPESPPEFPPLFLKSMTVCRETRGVWPRRDGAAKMRSVADRSVSEALFGGAGADGGLYDPPPVGSDDQAKRYMLLDLEGTATVLFPHMMDQDPTSFDGNGWVTTLDWTPGSMRYQVDRKVGGGKHIMGLRTLELSEVQRMDADAYRPKDGGEDMRQ
eukprot:CAMPEP_0195289346 /NCGR_PEP_ID=MMETSP0707-20130614/5664_1 /TAXON_ID=33640 /ORGANISM="Asterionellopsis glacialis, Strain CCMP134" /LENGTH=485 /DNA_ID=CAMNT_0040349339 /DNA_START=338 /DNA_END=1795 /DNA_ORIENTATION=-